jgi:ankyrin repeat protein
MTLSFPVSKLFADVNARDEQGRTALQLAEETDARKIRDVLIKAGAGN